MPAVTEARIDFRPMLCEPFDLARFKRNNLHEKEWIVQPKLNGIRCIYTRGGLYTRKGKPIVCCQHLLDDLAHLHLHDDVYLDGELFWKRLPDKKDQDLGKIVSSTRKTVTSVSPEDSEQIGYHIFDLYDLRCPELTFEQRYKNLQTMLGWVRSLGVVTPENLRVVPNLPVNPHDFEAVYRDGSLEAINPFETGHEGSILRRLDAPYHPGKRSFDILKIKAFQDAEFEVVGVRELMSHEKLIVEANTPGGKQYADGSWYKNGAETPQNTLGAFVCKTENGLTFAVGSGLNDEQRDFYWKNPPIGKMATIQYQELSPENKIPLFPVFIVIRDYE